MSDAARILIIDDEPNVRLMFRTTLEAAGYEVATVADGRAALDHLERGEVDLVLLDLQMPVMTGVETLQRLRDVGYEVAVVIVTAYGSVVNAVQAMKLGAIDFLAKPLSPESLRRVAAEVLARETDQAATALSRTSPEGGLAGESLSRAKGAITRRAFDEAEGWLREAIARDDRCAEGHDLLGVLHELRNDRVAAYSAHLAALHADPQFLLAQMHLMKSLADKLG